MNSAKVRDAIRGLQVLLRKHNVVSYAPVIDEIASRLSQYPETGIPSELAHEIRGLFGAMGSLTDIVICRANGDLVDDEEAANKTLENLQDALWKALTDGDTAWEY